MTNDGGQAGRRQGLRQDARGDKKTAHVDCANADNEDESAPGDAVCDEKCASDVIANFRESRAEPDEAK